MFMSALKGLICEAELWEFPLAKAVVHYVALNKVFYIFILKIKYVEKIKYY